MGAVDAAIVGALTVLVEVFFSITSCGLKVKRAGSLVVFFQMNLVGA